MRIDSGAQHRPPERSTARSSVDAGREGASLMAKVSRLASSIILNVWSCRTSRMKFRSQPWLTNDPAASDTDSRLRMRRFAWRGMFRLRLAVHPPDPLAAPRPAIRAQWVNAPPDALAIIARAAAVGCVDELGRLPAGSVAPSVFCHRLGGEACGANRPWSSDFVKWQHVTQAQSRASMRNVGGGLPEKAPGTESLGPRRDVPTGSWGCQLGATTARLEGWLPAKPTCILHARPCSKTMALPKGLERESDSLDKR